ncbi:B3 domain-containing protein REM12-like isoform X2 [Capsella rubella]|uniref:B3 domain-containing protein REM12-like isoform X2 n=1 Tax=Capsella rubella TaxID=81985 RepID=UPI000CD4D598|nr:B3 domain-containing protein REM12-like isoform X2 [Capsella rubella]
MLNLSDFGPGSCENRDLPAPSSNNDQHKTGNISRKKHRRLRTDEGDDEQNNTEHVRKKKMKKNNLETEADSSSDHSCFVALVTDSNLHKDALYLPQDLTSSVGLQRNCSKIIVTDGRERSWEMDLSFDNSSDTFYISQGWRSFCDENGKKAGGVFVFKLVGNMETPILSFCSTESINDGTQGNKKNKENCMHLERKEKPMRCRNSTSPSKSRFVTLTLTHDNLIKSRRGLPLPFTKENGLERPGMITLLGTAGMKWVANLQREASGRMVLGKGWSDFVKANGLKTGESFTLEAIVENKTPMLSLFSTRSTSEQGECSKDSKKELISSKPSGGEKMMKANNIKAVRRDSVPAGMKRFVTLTLKHTSLKNFRHYLPLSFTRIIGLDKPGIINLVGKDGTKWEANLLREKREIMCLGKGWKKFALSNGLKSGDSFTLEAILENGTLMLSLFSTQSTSDESQQRECSKDSEKELTSSTPSSGDKMMKTNKIRDMWRNSFPAGKKRFVTLTFTHTNLKKCRQYLPMSFTRKIGLDKPGIITLVGKDGTKWEASLLKEKKEKMWLGKGWKKFALSNGLKSGDSFTLEAFLENGTPMLSLFSTQSTSDGSQQREFCKDSEKGSTSAEPSRGNKNRNATNDSDERRDSSSSIQNRFVTLTLTPEDVRDCKLILPSQFMKASGINKLGKITILGQHKMKCFAYLLSKDGVVALGSGWKGFCEANGVKIGDSFTLEYIDEQDTSLVLKFSSKFVG